jgi:hypothetical protein
MFAEAFTCCPYCIVQVSRSSRINCPRQWEEDSSDAFGHCTCLTSNTSWVAVLFTAVLSIIHNAEDSRLFPNTSTVIPSRPGCYLFVLLDPLCGIGQGRAG